jgi:hypothetical protein
MSIWFRIKRFLEKSKTIGINLFTLNFVGAMKNSLILTIICKSTYSKWELALYVRVHILSGSYGKFILCEWHIMNKCIPIIIINYN